MFDTLSKKHDFNFNNVTDWVLQFGEFPELNKVREIINPDSFDESNGDYLIRKFKKELISFNQDSLFQAYLIDVKELNEIVIKQVKQSKSIQHLPAYLEKYYGSELSSYNLILSPLVHSGGFNSKFIAGGKIEVYAIIGPNGEIEHIPYFEKGYLEMDMILHEFGHSFVNPLTEKFQKEIETINEKYYNESLKKDGKAQAYGEWKYLFNELVVRAITIRIANKYFGTEKAKELLSNIKLDHRFEHKPSQLSGGEQQRVAVARAMINNPAILLADEPTGNLDNKLAKELHELLLKMRADFNQTILIVTHDIKLAQGCDRIIKLVDGKVSEEI